MYDSSTSPDQTRRPDQFTATLWVQLFGVTPFPHRCRRLLCYLPRFGIAVKAMALGDVADGDRRELNHALRTATRSQLPLRQLPPQVHAGYMR